MDGGCIMRSKKQSNILWFSLYIHDVHRSIDFFFLNLVNKHTTLIIWWWRERLPALHYLRVCLYFVLFSVITLLPLHT